MNEYCCNFCKSFSKASGKRKGFCLRHKKATDKNFKCGNYKPDVHVKYQQEYKPIASWW